MAARTTRSAALRTLPDVTLPATELAPRLIGCLLVRVVDGERRSGVIIETEAYPGGDDEASHTRRGLRTPRNASMWLEGGHAYVFFTYGMHWMCNVVSGRAGSGEAVLIRAIRPLEGIEAMRNARGAVSDADLCRGPARLAAALSIGQAHDGCDLTGLRPGGPDGGLRLEPPRRGTPERAAAILASPRVGIASSGAWAQRPWRFSVAGSDLVSRPRPVDARVWRAGSLRR